jgi:hypothetical protein
MAVAIKEFCQKAKDGDQLTHTEGGVIWPENIAVAPSPISFKIPKTDELWNVFILVCVAYKEPEDTTKTIHASGNIFFMMRRDAKSGSLNTIGSNGVTVQKSDIIFAPSLPGYAD